MNETAPASFGLRLLAFLVDVVILSAILSVLFLVLPGTASFPSVALVPSFATLPAGVTTAVTWAYFLITTQRFGGSIGKLAFGLKVQRADGEPLDWLTLAVREIPGKLVSLLPAGLGYLWISWDARKQGFHDKIAGTVVVKG